MNWLAHAFLSGPDPEARLGNVLADVIRGPEPCTASAALRRGIEWHHAIDAFTDAHPVVARSRDRVPPGYRRFGGVLVDVFYDHFLARDWHRYSPQPLGAYLRELYGSIGDADTELPPDARAVAVRMAAEDWLGAYRNVSGIQAALARISDRLGRRRGRAGELGGAVGVLLTHADEFEGDFAEFFPDLCSLAGSWGGPAGAGVA